MDLDHIARITQRVEALAEQREQSIMDAIAERHHTVTDIAKAAGMTRAGVHKLVARRTMYANRKKKP